MSERLYIPEEEPEKKESSHLSGDWYAKKFINARDIEGEPQAEKIQYVRELFESFGELDKRFSGAAVLGSTMKGYGNGPFSDIDVAVLYDERPKIKYVPGKEAWPETGVHTKGHLGYVHSFLDDLLAFQTKFNSERRKEGKPVFAVDMNPEFLDLNFYMPRKLFSKRKIGSQELHSEVHLFYTLCYPTINNPNSTAPIDFVIEKMKQSFDNLPEEEKEARKKDILDYARNSIGGEYDKFSNRTKNPPEKEEYVNSRIELFKRRLSLKFGISI